MILILIFSLLFATEVGFQKTTKTSKLNRTSTPLAAGQMWTGSWEFDHRQPAITFGVLTDQPGEICIDLRTPNTLATVHTHCYEVKANDYEDHHLNLGGNHFRLRFDNTSASAQTTLEVHSAVGAYGENTHPASSVIGQDTDALVTRNMGYKELIEDKKFEGVRYVSKFAENNDVDAAEDIWDGGADYTGFPSETETLQVLSSSAADTSAGTGARTVRVFYLDANKNCFDANEEFLYEDFTLNGTTPVTGTATASRVWLATLLSSGSGNTNAGVITVRHSTTTANVFTAIYANTGQSETSNFTICSGYKAYLEQVAATMLDNNTNRGKIALIRRLSDGTQILERPFIVSTAFETERGDLKGVEFNAAEDIIWRALSVSSVNGDVTLSYRLRLVKQ